MGVRKKLLKGEDVPNNQEKKMADFQEEERRGGSSEEGSSEEEDQREEAQHVCGLSVLQKGLDLAIVGLVAMVVFPLCWASWGVGLGSAAAAAAAWFFLLGVAAWFIL